MQERVFMGIGNKPFMDIQPSDAAIHDRAVNYVLMGRGATVFHHSLHHLILQFKSAHTVISLLYHSFALSGESHLISQTILYFCRKQDSVLSRILPTGRASWRTAQISWFRELLIFLLFFWEGLSAPCRVPVWVKAKSGFRGCWRICITSWSFGRG